MNEEQQSVIEMMENQIHSVGFTPIQSLTMGLSYFKGGHYDTLSDKEFEAVVKAFVEKYM